MPDDHDWVFFILLLHLLSDVKDDGLRSEIGVGIGEHVSP